MNDFEASLQEQEPPNEASVYLQALWYDANGNWNKAHSLVDNLEGSTAAAVHAYMHRVEGDNWNASYWYKKAGKNRPDISLQEEWKALVEELIKQG